MYSSRPPDAIRIRASDSSLAPLAPHLLLADSGGGWCSAGNWNPVSFPRSAALTKTRSIKHGRRQANGIHTRRAACRCRRSCDARLDCENWLAAEAVSCLQEQLLRRATNINSEQRCQDDDAPDERVMTAAGDPEFRQIVSNWRARNIMNISVSPIFDDPLQEDAGATDYAEIYINQMNGLYLLSFLVAADRQVAERCFSKALDEYVEARGGFLEWCKQDGRRAVLRQAIRIIRPAPKQAYYWSFYGNAGPLVSAAHQPFAAITSLSPFERFVFVMSVIQGLSQKECAALLNCSIEDVTIGRELASNCMPGRISPRRSSSTPRLRSAPVTTRT